MFSSSWFSWEKSAWERVRKMEKRVRGRRRKGASSVMKCSWSPTIFTYIHTYTYTLSRANPNLVPFINAWDMCCPTLHLPPLGQCIVLSTHNAQHFSSMYTFRSVKVLLMCSLWYNRFMWSSSIYFFSFTNSFPRGKPCCLRYFLSTLSLIVVPFFLAGLSSCHIAAFEGCVWELLVAKKQPLAWGPFDKFKPTTKFHSSNFMT